MHAVTKHGMSLLFGNLIKPPKKKKAKKRKPNIFEQIASGKAQNVVTNKIGNAAVKVNNQLGIVTAKNLSAETKKKYGIPPKASDADINEAMANARFEGDNDRTGKRTSVQVKTTVKGQKVEYKEEKKVKTGVGFVGVGQGVGNTGVGEVKKSETKTRDITINNNERVRQTTVTTFTQEVDGTTGQAETVPVTTTVTTQAGNKSLPLTNVEDIPSKIPKKEKKKLADDLGDGSGAGGAGAIPPKVDPVKIAEQAAAGQVPADKLEKLVKSRSGKTRGPKMINEAGLDQVFGATAKRAKKVVSTTAGVVVDPTTSFWLDTLSNPWIVIPGLVVVYGGAVYIMQPRS